MKTYDFRFVSYPAKFEHGLVTTSCGVDDAMSTESKTCTVADAIAYLPDFAKSLSVPNSTWFYLDDRVKRLPAGYTKARRWFDFNPAA